MKARHGVTLVELLVVITLLSVIAAVSGLALHRARPLSSTSEIAAAVMAARDSSLRTGHVVTVTMPDSALGTWRPVTATAYPDGRVLADRALGIDPFTGRVPHATR